MVIILGIVRSYGGLVDDDDDDDASFVLAGTGGSW